MEFALAGGEVPYCAAPTALGIFVCRALQQTAGSKGAPLALSE